MPRIRCHYTDCVFLDENYCGAAAVEFDPDTGCATYSPSEGAAVAGEEWDNELEEWEEDETEEEDSDWAEEEEDEF
jgi:hypothetical protein